MESNKSNTPRPILHTRDKFTESFETYANSALMERLERKFAPRPYFEKYKVFRVLALVASYTFNTFSALTAAALVYFFVEQTTGSTAAAVLVTVTALTLLEASKRAANSILWRNVLQYRRAGMALISAVVLFSAMSISSSYFGAKKIIAEFTPPPISVDANDATADITAQITAIDTQIEDARKTRYKGTTTNTSARTIEALTNQKATLINELARIRKQVDEGNASELSEHKETVFFTAESFAAITLLLELLFVLCAFYLEFYDFRSLAEFATIEAGTANATTSHTAGTQATQPAPPAHQPKATQNGQHNATMSAGRQIGFLTGNAMRYDAMTQHPPPTSEGSVAQLDPAQKVRPCAHCGNQYAARTTWQKFCSEACRKEYHAHKHDGVPYDPAKRYGHR